MPMPPHRTPAEIKSLQDLTAAALEEYKAASSEAERLRAMSRTHPWNSPKPPNTGLRVAFEPKEEFFCIYDLEGFVTATKNPEVLTSWLKAEAEIPGCLARAVGLERKARLPRATPAPAHRPAGDPDGWVPNKLPPRPGRTKTPKVSIDLSDLDL